MRPLRLLTAALSLVTIAAPAHAWHYDCRFIERVGAQDVVLPGNIINASNGNVRNIRVQFGAFDDADSLAPAGGFVGWNVGTLAVSGPASNSDERRNNGRLQPFTFAGQPTANGDPPLPAGDPFTMLTEIDATLGTQGPVWNCGDPDGDGVWGPLPMPQATIRGLNTFVSVFAFSIDPSPGAVSYNVTASGNLIAAREWRVIGNPTPPDCEGCPNDPLCNDMPASVTYAPYPEAPRGFTCQLTVFVPSPTGATMSILVGGVVLSRRRRRRGMYTGVLS